MLQRCARAEQDLDAYRDRELAAAAAALVREHLDRCPACRRLLAEREALGQLVRAARPEEAPAGLRARVVARLWGGWRER